MGITDSNITTGNILKNFFVGASGLEVCTLAGWLSNDYLQGLKLAYRV